MKTRTSRPNLIKVSGVAPIGLPATGGSPLDFVGINEYRPAQYVEASPRATAEGVPVKGYFQWSTMDNLEWSAGFGNRFGLVYVDFKTLKRTPKLSAMWFREASRRNAVV